MAKVLFRWTQAVGKCPPLGIKAVNRPLILPREAVSTSCSFLQCRTTANCQGIGNKEDERTIYRGILATQIKLVKSFSLMTSAIGLSCQPILYTQLSGVESGKGFALVLCTGAFISFFTFVTPILIHWVSKKYVIELMYNKIEDSYTAVTYSLLLRKKQTKFAVKDVMVPELPGMFTTFKVKNVPLFVDGTQFDNASHFEKIMGYDKPVDLRWRDSPHPKSGP